MILAMKVKNRIIHTHTHTLISERIAARFYTLTYWLGCPVITGSGHIKSQLPAATVTE